MNKSTFLKNLKSFYFIGIGGVNMSALALYLHDNGYKVGGSDLSNNEYVKTLKKAGITVNNNHYKNNIDGYNTIVYTSAIKENCPELIEANKRKLPTFKRSQLLSFIIANFDKSIAVSGTHGKTTTTALLTEIFSLKFGTTAFIGGESKNFSNIYSSGNDVCITEACEYEKNFLDLFTTDKIILNVDRDHVDSYSDIDEQINTFNQFANGSYSIVNGDNINCKKITASCTFGLNNTNNIYAKNIKDKKNGLSFNVYTKHTKILKAKVKLHGVENVYNCLSVIAVCLKYKIDVKTIKKGLKNFNGVTRRNEYLGQFSRIRYYADYAHHPTEIDCYLKNFFKFNRGKTLIIFQPHTYSRTRELIDEFVKVLSKYDNVAIYKTYPAREEYDRAGSAYQLYNKLQNNSPEKTLMYLENLSCFSEIVFYYKNVIILGAGDLYDKIKKEYCKKSF